MHRVLAGQKREILPLTQLTCLYLFAPSEDVVFSSSRKKNTAGFSRESIGKTCLFKYRTLLFAMKSKTISRLNFYFRLKSAASELGIGIHAPST